MHMVHANVAAVAFSFFVGFVAVADALPAVTASSSFSSLVCPFSGSCVAAATTARRDRGGTTSAHLFGGDDDEPLSKEKGLSDLRQSGDSDWLSGTTFLGTHDSDSWWLGDDLQPGAETTVDQRIFLIAKNLGVPVADFLRPWFHAQTLSVGAQLEAGARYLDLRCGWNGTRWVGFHGLQGRPFDEVIAEVALFANRTDPSAVLVLEIGHFYNDPPALACQSLFASLNASLGYMALGPNSPLLTDPERTRIGDLVAANQRIVIALDDCASGVIPVPSRFWRTEDALNNTYADTSNVEQMIAYNRGVVAWFNASSMTRRRPLFPLLKVSWTLTPSTLDVIRGIISRLAREKALEKKKRAQAAHEEEEEDCSDSGEVERHILERAPRSLREMERSILADVATGPPDHKIRANHIAEQVCPSSGGNCMVGNILLFDFW